MNYKEGYSASWDWKIGKDHFEGKKYSCGNCGQTLLNEESYVSFGSVYCGSCYQGK
jgi:late competence protein required for DNA uptake (superfamily II DNA/RNA helicase)